MFCDHHDGSECLQKFDSHRIYSIQVKESKQNSWYDFGYYMYFHTRQTPGLYVEFSRSLSDQEFLNFKETVHCKYRLYKEEGREISGHIEGMKIFPDKKGFWCFDYLGSMLVSFHKKYGTVNEKPSSDFFPVSLEISYGSSLKEIHGSATAEIHVEW